MIRVGQIFHRFHMQNILPSLVCLRLDSPSVREEVDFNVRIPGPAVFPGRQVFGAQDGDDQLMTDFVVPEFDLWGQSGARSETLVLLEEVLQLLAIKKVLQLLAIEI